MVSAVSETCAVLPCAEVTQCPLKGGCIHKASHVIEPMRTESVVVYNPMTGGRRDLEVTAEEDGAATQRRWDAARKRYEGSRIPR